MSSDPDGFDVTVTKRSTSTVVTCSPGTIPANDTTTCTAVVSDTDSGTKSHPTGTVTFSVTGGSSRTSPARPARSARSA